MPLPNRNRRHLTVNVAPETAETLRRLAYEQRTSRGDIIDAAIQEMTMTDDETTALTLPPRNIMQVLAWSEDLGLQPSQDQWQQARNMPETASLRDVLMALGWDGHSTA